MDPPRHHFHAIQPQKAEAGHRARGTDQGMHHSNHPDDRLTTFPSAARPAADRGPRFRSRLTKPKEMQTEAKPTPMPGTSDGELVTAVWSVFSGWTPALFLDCG
jgi:hypothetical protein